MVEPMDPVCVMVEPAATVALTFTTKVKFAVALAANVPMVQVKGLAELQVQPAGPVSDTNVVFAGRVSVSVTVLALAGPPFVTVCA